MERTEVIESVLKARDSVDAVRDFLPDLRSELDLEDDLDVDFLRSLFEAPFSEVVEKSAINARENIFFHAIDKESTLLSAYNEYVNLMSLMSKISDSANTNFSRPASDYAVEVAEANNPVGAAYAILRKNKKLTDKQVTVILEAAFPLATNGLDEEARDFLYELASERGVSSVEVANAYVELAELVTAFRFMADDDLDEESFV